MKTRCHYFFILALLCLPQLRASYDKISRPCAILLSIAAHPSGHPLSGSVKLKPTKTIDVPAAPYMPHYKDALIVFEEGEIPKLARSLADGLALEDSKEIEDKLRKAKGAEGISIKEILPSRISEKLGSFACDQTYFCYRAALNFHKTLPFEHVRGMGPTIENLPDYVFEKYRNLAPREELRFGDLIFFYKRLPPDGAPYPLHVAIYLGGDLVYHKFGADTRFPYEITTLEGINTHYFLSAQQKVNQFPNIVDWNVPAEMTFLRYDGGPE